MNKTKKIVRITKEFNFEMAHALYGYDGPCANIHGHSYHLSVTVKGVPKQNNEHPKNGMLLDFGELKQLIQKEIINSFDHSLTLNKRDPFCQTLSKSQLYAKVIELPYQPTIENMIVDFAHKIKKLLPKPIKLHAMKLQETSTSFAEWYADDNPD